MPKINSRNKGARAEVAFAKELASVLGVEARRGRQYSGSPDSPDIVTNIEGVHFECKRTEKFSLYEALDQAQRDAPNDIPVVLHRKNNRKTVVCLYLEHLDEYIDRQIKAQDDIENKNAQRKTETG